MKYKWHKMDAFDKDALISNTIFGTNITEKGPEWNRRIKDNDYLFHYTRYLDDALRVVEKVGLTHKFKCLMTICDGKLNGWEVEFGQHRVYARTLPMAICLCALKCYSVDV